MIRVGMVKANNVLAALAPFALDAHQFAGIDVVTVLRRIGPSVAAARRRGHSSRAIIVRLPEQYSAALVRIGLFAVTAKGFVILVCDLQHVRFGTELRMVNF